MRGIVVVPLESDGNIIGTLAALTPSTAGPPVLRTTAEVARYVSGQLELAELDDSRDRLNRAEVRALRAQISPHFVYNALTTIASFIRTDPNRARELLIEFADFTRYSFRSAGEYTTLTDELDNINRYIRLEKARFGNRLNIRLQIDSEVLNVVLPFLALQPLVENAVRHGLSGKPNGGTITIRAENAGTECVIVVEDDGVGMDPDRLNEDLDDAHLSGAHVGLGNVDDRMRSAFGDNFGLVVDTGDRRRYEDHPAGAEVPGGHPGLTRTSSSVRTGESHDIALCRSGCPPSRCARAYGGCHGCPAHPGRAERPVARPVGESRPAAWSRWSVCTG